MSQRQTTGLRLDAAEALRGLLDFGLFGEKVPPCFSSESLHTLLPGSHLKIRTEKNAGKLEKLLKKQSRGSIRYQVIRDVGIPRLLGVPHPQAYSAQCLAIARCWDSIKKHCAKPTQPISRIFVREVDGNRVFQMSYKGSERFEREEQEIEFTTGSRYVVHADVSTCFPSIYTHSLPWAIHGKRKAKTSGGDLRLTGNILDCSARVVRDSQTNGLLVGPHASNVLSEIVLTSVDAAIIKKGYVRTTRHIDDYKCYVRSTEEAEGFIRDLGLALREFELTLNEKKTRILPLPRPTTENWIRELHAFQFSTGEVRYSQMRHFLDLALHLSQSTGTSAVLNYAIKMMPDNLNERARRLFVHEAVNLTLSYPYLAPLLGEFVFKDGKQPGITPMISSLCSELLTIGLRRIYPDSIAWALFYAIKYDIVLSHSESELKKIVLIDDCVSDVLLLEYSKRRGLKTITRSITARANNLKGLAAREQDAFWLLIYDLWPEAELRGNGQQFLADLKKSGYQFVRF